MSVLNVCTTDMDREIISRRYRNPSLYHRIIKSSSTTTDSYDNYSSYTSTSTSSSFEVIFTRLIDVLIFTSAIAITAYSYLTGTLIQPLVEGPKPTVLVGYSSQHQKKRHSHSEGSHSSSSSSQLRHHHHHHKLHLVHDPIEDAKRRRTQEWAEQQIMPVQHHQQQEPNSPIPTPKKRSTSSSGLEKVRPLSRDNNNNNNMKHERQRTRSLPSKQPDELLSQTELLLKQAQDALSTPVKL